ncbi:DUF5916 domain-containing protein [Pseudothauera rhizosphaerae]|uniref:DUF5916 domain-containing protein n=1 Tax=Pseudothauera rhizosphaerae TaxID=2565932 RepID=UPI001E53173E|nr:DUF5916 domain-containing protein [Pseudothauera rhizosphaerae]
MTADLPRMALALAAMPAVALASATPPPADSLVHDAFVQAAPATGAAPTRRTRLRLWQDARTLFVDIQADDAEPGAIVARQMRRDVEGMLAEDQVTLVIDAEGAGRNGYLFAVNAHGAQFDALIYDGGLMRHDWDAQWTSEARIGADGWRARLAIPLSVFGRGDSATWRINAERWMPRGSERVRLAGARPDKTVYSLGDAIAIPALRSGRDGGGLRIKPSLRVSHESSAASGSGKPEQRIEPGLELFHESHGGLRTTAALNIDFGEAEADERTVNLTRFELFRPEKREFFLRDAGRFSFGGLVEAAVIPYYSRRIGLDAGGRARALDAGLKLTGSAAGLEFGAFAARVAGGATEPGLPDQPSADVAVLRLAKPLDARQRVGLLATRGNPQGTAGSRLWGVDYQFRDTTWSGGRTLEAHGWAMQSTNADAAAGADVTGRAWGGSLAYLNTGPMASAEFQRIGAGFDPALGYLAEANVLRGQGTAGWWHRTRDGASVIPAVDWSYRRTLDGAERTRVLNPEVAYTNAAGDTVMAEVFFEADRLASGYAPVPGTWLAPGSYRWQYLYGLLETSPSRPLWVSAELRAGGYYDGRRNDQFVTLGWKPDSRWEARVGMGRNAITLPTGRFTVKLATLRLDHAPDTRLAQSVLLQWDNVSQALGVSARLRWTDWLGAPGRELVFALDRLGYTGDRREPLPRQTRATLKLVWNLER